MKPINDLLKSAEKVLEAFETISKQKYPAKIFKPMQQKDWTALHRFCENHGYSLDRISGEYGRMFTVTQANVASEALPHAQLLVDALRKE